MKKLYFGILLLLLPIICFGQVSGGLIVNSAHYVSSEDIPAIMETDSVYGWWEASSTYLSLTDDSIVDQWNDRSGRNFHLTPYAASGDEPIFYGDSITFDGVDHNLQYDNWVDGGGDTIEHRCLIFAVVNQVSFSSGAFIFDFGTPFLDQRVASPQLRMGATSNLSNNTTGTIGVFELYVLEFDGANSGFQINDETKVTGDVGDHPIRRIQVGANLYGSATSNISVKEIVIMGDIDTSDSTAVRNYLNTKHALY
jgi:hypothetical protein